MGQIDTKLAKNALLIKTVEKMPKPILTNYFKVHLIEFDLKYIQACFFRESDFVKLAIS